ncbi:MAG: hypothetical protein K6T87_02075 [Roseiflexus sp.]|nr:hypothetical protein [Roseiflexus sp.]
MRTISESARHTDSTFTGQRVDPGVGLMYYGVRYCDAALGRFIVSDAIVPEPGNPQAVSTAFHYPPSHTSSPSPSCATPQSHPACQRHPALQRHADAWGCGGPSPQTVRSRSPLTGRRKKSTIRLHLNNPRIGVRPACRPTQRRDALLAAERPSRQHSGHPQRDDGGG